LCLCACPLFFFPFSLDTKPRPFRGPAAGHARDGRRGELPVRQLIFVDGHFPRRTTNDLGPIPPSKCERFFHTPPRRAGFPSTRPLPDRGGPCTHHPLSVSGTILLISFFFVHPGRNCEVIRQPRAGAELWLGPVPDLGGRRGQRNQKHPWRKMRSQVAKKPDGPFFGWFCLEPDQPNWNPSPARRSS